jgi:hypothetical protein
MRGGVMNFFFEDHNIGAILSQYWQNIGRILAISYLLEINHRIILSAIDTRIEIDVGNVHEMTCAKFYVLKNSEKKNIST